MIRPASEAGGERALRSDYEVGRTLIGPAKELGTWAVENSSTSCRLARSTMPASETALYARERRAIQMLSPSRTRCLRDRPSQ